MGVLTEIAESLAAGQAPKVAELTQAAVEQGVRVQEVLNKGLVAGMGVVGGRFERKEAYLPDLLMAAQAMHGAMEILEPLLLDARVELLAKVALGTVQGDIHDIGKNLVGIMMRGSGFEVVDLGIDVAPERFVEAAQQGAQLIGMSALTGPTMSMMKTTIEALEEAGFKGKVKTVVGGAIVTQAYADRIGADGYARDAVVAANKAKELLGLG